MELGRTSIFAAPTSQSTDGLKDRVLAAKSGGAPAFAEILSSRSSGVKISAHAQSRLSSRDITVTPDMMNSLSKAVDKAQEKGGRDTLVMLNNLAFIVNVPNRTVVTAMDGESLKDNVFTNIDSAVIAG